MDTNDFYFYDYRWSGEKAPSYLPNEDGQDFDDLDQASQLEKYIQNYYYFNPDTLMPLLFLALASKDRLKVTENASPAPGAYCSYSLKEMGNQSWVKKDSELSARIRKLLRKGTQYVDIEFELDTQTAAIYGIFKQNDEVTVVQEYHHRIGRLVNHLSDPVAFKSQQRYSILRLVRFILKHESYIKSSFISIYNDILELSGLQPKRPRLEIARAIRALLGYAGRGVVYNPFAGISFVGAMLQAGNQLYADGDSNPKLLAAGQLLNYGMGGNNLHYVQRDSMQWLYGCPLDYVFSTYRGNIGSKAALAVCYEKCRDTLASTGRFVGVVTSSDLFESGRNRHPELAEVIKDAVKEDTLDTLIVMPFNETVILFNKQKSEPRKVKIYNRLSMFAGVCEVDEMLSTLQPTCTLTNADIRRAKYKLKHYIVNDLEPMQDHDIVSASRFLKRLDRRTYSTRDMDSRSKAMLVIDRNTPYNQLPAGWMMGLNKQPFHRLLNPAYRLCVDALIVNDTECLEPRLFCVDEGEAFFEDGLAFGLRQPFDIKWFMDQLTSPYVDDQLFPYGRDTLLPNRITEETIMDLRLCIPLGHTGEAEDSDRSSNRLGDGYTLHDVENKLDYVILNSLNNGCFGITYRALQKDLLNGATREVVLKEFFMTDQHECSREGNRVVVNPGYEREVLDFRARFINEAEILMKLGHDSENHIMRVLNYFQSRDTDTVYYAMNNYANGNLDGLLKRKHILQEQDVIEHILKPLATALQVVHSQKILHLDIKPDNIMLDENMDATLTDFGIAKQYEASGEQSSNDTPIGTKRFSAPEQCGAGRLVRFAAPTDIYSLAGTLYYLFSHHFPHPVTSYSNEDEDLKANMRCSDRTKEAIVRGLMRSPEARPQTIQEFLNLFPGCEEIRFS